MSDISNDPDQTPEPVVPSEADPNVTGPVADETRDAAPEAPAEAATPVPPQPWEQPERPRYGEYAPQAPEQPQQPQAPQPPQPVDPQAVTQPQPPYGAFGQPQAPQPTAPQPGVNPTQPTQPYPGYAQQGGQPGGQYPGQPGQYPGHPGAPQQPGQPPYGQFYNPYARGPKPPKQPKAPREPGERRGLSGRTIALIAAGLVVGAIIGGAAGGGIGAAVRGGNGTPVANSSGAQNITINDPKNATQVAAVAAKASNSVVTINVTASQEAGTGSGVILTSDGYVLTNTHVVTLDGDVSTATIQVQTNDGKLYNAKVIGTDPTDDLAVIKLQDASGLEPITFADSSKLNVGDQVIAIGAPLGLSGTVTDGIVSALNRSVSLQSSAAPSGGSGSSGDGSDGSDPFGSGSGSDPFGFLDPSNPFDGGGQSQQSTTDDTISVPAIQTDAAINPGNSGGALLNAKGELVGINVAIASTGSSDSSGDAQSGNIGVGFAIPSDVAQRIGNELKQKGTATHGLLGATVSNAAVADGATTVGARVESTVGGGAAAKAGLKEGDVITNFNGFPITSATDLTAQVRSSAAKSSASVTYVRGGKSYDAKVTLGTYNPSTQQ